MECLRQEYWFDRKKRKEKGKKSDLAAVPGQIYDTIDTKPGSFMMLNIDGSMHAFDKPEPKIKN